MDRNSSMARVKLLILLIPIFLLVALPDAATGQSSSKVSSSLRAMMTKIKDRHISRYSVRSFGLSTLSNRLVRIDAGANIQTYIRVYTFGSAERAQLEAQGVRIEIVK